jgi:hypothetical protein
MTGREMTDDSRSPEDWREPSLAGLAAISIEAMPGFEILFLDDLAGYLMGAGPLEPPYTVEHGSRVVSALFGAILNSAQYSPAEAPIVTAGVEAARARFVQGGHDLAARGPQGVNQLLNRLIPAVLGELEIYKAKPEDQTCSLFYHSLLAVASGPLNLLTEQAAAGVMEIFHGWDEQFGKGFIPPWRRAVGA